MSEHDLCCARVKLGIARGDLHHAVPKIVVDEIPRFVDDLKSDMDEPLPIVHAVTFRENRSLDREFLANIKISRDEILDEFVDDGVHVGSVAHGKQQRQRPFTDRYVRIVQGVYDFVLIHLDRFSKIWHGCEGIQRVESQVPDVRFLHLEKISKDFDAQIEQLVRVIHARH